MEMNKVFSKVFMWMFIGLLVTFATGYIVSANENMLYNVFKGGTYFILVIVEIVLVLVLAARIQKMNPTTAKILFILYSFVTGLTFGSIFVVYKLSAIMLVFLITSIMFGLFALIGAFTNINLTKLGTILFMALIGVILCAIINIFLHNSAFDMAISCVSVLIFLGFVAYDIQKIKVWSETMDEDRLAILGALELYIDFINIFLDLLRLFGNRD